MGEANQTIVQLTDVQFAWHKSSNPVIHIPDFKIVRGEHLFLQGPSGSGKTTLLSLIAAVLSPQQGQIVIDGVALNTLRRSQRDQFRVDRIGLVFQQFNLLPFLSVAENIQLSCRFSKHRRARAGERWPAAKGSGGTRTYWATTSYYCRRTHVLIRCRF